jgi:hypothetical protein
MIPRERGIKGLRPYIISLFTHLIILERNKWLHELLGEMAMWILIPRKYINLSFALLGGFIFPHPLFDLPHSW